MRYHLIINPQAGRGHGEKVFSDLVEYARSVLGDVAVSKTQYPGHAQEIAARLNRQVDVVIAAGGDGTVHEVVNGLMGGTAKLAVVPIGSGNDFVKMINMPLEFHKAVDVIKRGRTMTVDMGRMGDVYFPNGLGIGFDAVVVQESKKVTRLRGFLIYLYSVLRALTYYKNRSIKLHVNGKVENREIFLIAVGNGMAMGGGFYLNPQAKINDGLLDVCIIHKLTKREALLNLPKAIKGQHGEMPQVEFIRTTHLLVEAPGGIPVHADGELVSANIERIEIEIIPSALTVIHNRES